MPRSPVLLDPVVPGLSLRLGDLLAGRYRLEALVACEATGATFAARQIHGREPVTVDVLAGYSDADRAEVALRVARARSAARLRSVHVARVVDIATTPDGMPFVVTTRPPGRTLDVVLAEHGKLEVTSAVGVALQVAAALAEAHALGLVHGDLEPRRVLVDEAATVTVLGFGVARATSSVGEASASTWFGSPSYLAPEHARTSDPDARADVWSLGILLHEMISGAPPFEGESVSAVLVAVAYDAAPLLTEAPYELASIVARCLAKDPGARFPGVVELARALLPFAGHGGEARLAEVERADAEARRREARERVRERTASPKALLPGSRAVRPPAARAEPSRAKVIVEGERASCAPRGDAVTLPSRRVTRARDAQRVRVAVLFTAALALVAALASAARLELRGRRNGTAPGPSPSPPAAARAPLEVAPFRPNLAAEASAVAAARLPDVVATEPRATTPAAPAPALLPRARRGAGAIVRTPPWPPGPAATSIAPAWRAPERASRPTARGTAARR